MARAICNHTNSDGDRVTTKHDTVEEAEKQATDLISNGRADSATVIYPTNEGMAMNTYTRSS